MDGVHGHGRNEAFKGEVLGLSVAVLVLPPRAFLEGITDLIGVFNTIFFTEAVFCVCCKASEIGSKQRTNEPTSKRFMEKIYWEVGFGVLGVEMTGLGTKISVPNTLPYPDILSGVPYPTPNF